MRQMGIVDDLLRLDIADVEPESPALLAVRKAMMDRTCDGAVYEDEEVPLLTLSFLNTAHLWARHLEEGVSYTCRSLSKDIPLSFAIAVKGKGLNLRLPPASSKAIPARRLVNRLRPLLRAYLPPMSALPSHHPFRHPTKDISSVACSGLDLASVNSARRFEKLHQYLAAFITCSTHPSLDRDLMVAWVKLEARKTRTRGMSWQICGRPRAGPKASPAAACTSHLGHPEACS